MFIPIKTTLLFMLISLTLGTNKQDSDHGSSYGHGSSGHGHGHAEPELYDPVNWFIIPPPPGPGPILIPGIQNLGECKDTVNRCLTDDSRQGLWNLYLTLKDSLERRPCYLVQALFNTCLGDLNCRTCIIQEATVASRCNIFYSLGDDFQTAYLNIHQYGADPAGILTWINATAVRQLVVAANNFCPN